MASMMRLVTFKQMRDELGIPWSRAHLQRLEDKGEFPKRIPLGDCRVVWDVHEIEEYIEQRIARRDRATRQRD
jgi:prophage regulatory protein